MAKLQQFTFVCAPSFAQVAAVEAIGHPLTEQIADYESHEITHVLIKKDKEHFCK